MKPNDILLIIDSILKAIVLLVFTLCIASYIVYLLYGGVVINFPDWIVSLFTIVFVFFFRRALKKKEGGKDE